MKNTLRGSHNQQNLIKHRLKDAKFESRFMGIQNIKLVGRGRLPLRFQRKSWEAKKASPERAACEPVGVKPKVEKRTKEEGDGQNTEHLPNKAAGRQLNYLQRDHVGCNQKTIVAHPSVLEFRSYYRVSWIQDMELQDLMFPLINCGLWSSSFQSTYSSLMEWKYLPCTIVLQNYMVCF